MASRGRLVDLPGDVAEKVQEAKAAVRMAYQGFPELRDPEGPHGLLLAHLEAEVAQVSTEGFYEARLLAVMQVKTAAH